MAEIMLVNPHIKHEAGIRQGLPLFFSARLWVVVVEAAELNSQTTTCHSWESFLLDRDYTFVYFDGLNRFYVSGHHPELNPVFAIPPNVFDGFRKV